MVGEGIVGALVLIAIWFLIFVVIPIGIGIFLLVRYKKRTSRQTGSLKKRGDKLLLATGLAAIGVGIFFVVSEIIVAELDRQRIEDLSNRPPSPAALEAMRKNTIQWTDVSFHSNQTDCCHVDLKLGPNSKDNGYGSIDFLRHVAGCTATSYDDYCQDEIIHTMHFRVYKNDTKFDPRLNAYRFDLSNADLRALQEVPKYDVVVNYNSNETGNSYISRLWDQSFDIR